MSQTFSPAHDLMGEQHAAHFGVLVLPLIDDCLGERRNAQAQEEEGCSQIQVQGRYGPYSQGRSCTPTCSGAPKKAEQELGPGSPNQEPQRGLRWARVA